MLLYQPERLVLPNLIWFFICEGGHTSWCQSFSLLSIRGIALGNVSLQQHDQIV